MEKGQRTTARLTCRRWRNTSSVGEMLDKLQWPILEAQRDQSSLLFFQKINCGTECRTKHPGTKHPMPFFATPDKTSRINLPPRTKHPMQFLSPRTKHPVPFLPPRTKHPMLLLPHRTKHPTLCLKPMKVHKTSHLVNCHYFYGYS